MIEAFFGFHHMPFGRDLPVESLWSNLAREEFQTRLEYVVKNKGFGVFTGDAGTGKTTALRRFAASLDKTKYQTLYISDSALTPRNFYWTALHQLNEIPRFYRGDAKRQLLRVLDDLTTKERRLPVVVVDEAHLLSREMLEEIRFLLNLDMDSRSALALILTGQSELRDILKLQVNAAIRQRMDMRYHMPSLAAEETADYVRSHLHAVGATGELFTEAALNQMHEYSEGVPRRINKLAILCLLSAATRKVRLVDDHMVQNVIIAEFDE